MQICVDTFQVFGCVGIKMIDVHTCTSTRKFVRDDIFDELQTFMYCLQLMFGTFKPKSRETETLSRVGSDGRQFGWLIIFSIRVSVSVGGIARRDKWQ